MAALNKSSVMLPILVIALGTAWLLNSRGVIPGVNWIWTGGLGVAGLLILVMQGVNKLSIVVGPFLLIGSVFSILRQTGQITLANEVPILTIVLGVLMLFAHLAPIRNK